MKKLYLVTTMLILSFLIVACGQNNDSKNMDDNNNDVTTNDGQQNDNTGVQDGEGNVTDDNGMTDDNSQTEDPVANTDDMVAKMESLDYVDFDLSVEYKDDQDYDADLELENNRVEASLEDDLNGINIEGDGAFNEIYPLVEQLTIDQNTSKDDVIAQILEVFDLPTDYTEFELEITFKDGTKKEYDDRK